MSEIDSADLRERIEGILDVLEVTEPGEREAAASALFGVASRDDLTAWLLPGLFDLAERMVEVGCTCRAAIPRAKDAWARCDGGCAGGRARAFVAEAT